jgi:DNA-binding response OmpR family regulator
VHEPSFIKDGNTWTNSAPPLASAQTTQHPGVTLSRDLLLKEVWAYSTEAFTRTVNIHLAGLRHKVEDNPKRSVLNRDGPGAG